MQTARRTVLRAALMSVVLLGLLLRFSEIYLLNMPEGRVWGVADDVYITADYARTVALGQGPLWYAGAPRVEGCSSPLWVLVMAPYHWLPGASEKGLGLYLLVVDA